MAEATVIGRVAIKVLPDTKGFRRSVQNDLDKIERQLDKIEVKLDLDGITKRRVSAEIKALARNRNLKIKPELDNLAVAKVASTLAALSGGRALQDMGEDFADWIGNLDRSVPRIAATSLAVTNLSSAVLASTSNLLAFGSSLASTAGAGLALPGILGGIALGTGAAVAVLKDFNTVLPEVADKFHDLQDSMSEKFWAKAKAPIREFIDEIFPQFAAGMEDTSSALGGFFSRLAGSAQGQFDGELQSMFDDLARSIKISGRYTDEFVGVIQRLGSVGAGNLPRLAKWFGDITGNFDDWLEGKGQRGLQEYVDTGVSALQDLGNVLRYTGSTFAGLATAAERAGGGSLAGVAEVLERVSRTVNKRSFQAGLTDVFEGAHDAMANIASGSGQQFESLLIRIGDLLSTVLPKAGDTLGTALGGIFDALDTDTVQNSLVGAFDNLDASVDNLVPSLPKVADALAGIVDVVGMLTQNVTSALAPALDHLAPAISGLSGDLEPLIEQLGDLLVNAVQVAGPIVEDLGEQLGDVAGVVADVLGPVNSFLDTLEKLPDPIKSLGSEAVAAGVLLWGLSAAVRGTSAAVAPAIPKLQQFYAEMTYGATRVAALQSALKGIAGVAGFVAVSKAADETNRTLSGLEQTAGLAAIGFSVGGPWGAAIGGTVGLFKGLWNTLTDTGDVLTRAQKPVVDYAASLDKITGAATQATRELLRLDLQQAGAFESASQLGISQRDLVSYLMGNKGAIDRVSAAIKNQSGEYVSYIDAMGNARQMWVENGTAAAGLEGALQGAGYRLREAGEEARRTALITEKLGDVYKGIPRKVLTEIRSIGGEVSIKQLRTLSKQIDLTPKTVRIIARANNLELTRGQIKRLADQAKDLGKTKVETPNMKPVQEGVKRGMDNARERAVQGLKEVRNKMDSGMSQATSSAAGKASSGGRQVGSNLKAGIVAGFEGTADTLARMASSAVLQAVAAAKHAGDIHSPSRKTFAIGKFLGEGLTLGLESQRRATQHAATQAVEDVVTIAATALRKVEKATSKSHTRLEKQVDHLNSKLKDKDLLAHLAKVNRAYESQWKQLDKGMEKLRGLRSEAASYQTSILDQIVGTGDPTIDGAVSYDAIRKVMEVARDQAVKFADVIAGLKNKLNKDTLQQLVTAGPEAGLATAQAIAASGQAGIDALNDIAADIRDAGKDLGLSASSAVFGEQIKQAAKDVRNLEKQLKPLEDRLGELVKRLFQRLAQEAKKGNKKLNDELSKVGDTDPAPRSSSPKTTASGSAKRSTSPRSDSGGNTYIYNAAPGPSMSSEEQLFGAFKRGRFPKP